MRIISHRLPSGRAILLGVALSYLLLTYFAPIANLLSLGTSWATYHDVLTSNYHWRILLNTFTFAGEVTLVSLAIGYPVAAVARMSDPRLGRLVLIISTVPLWTSLLGRTWAWLALLQRYGFVNESLIKLHIISSPLDLSRNTFGAFVGSVYIITPLMILALYGPMSSIDLGVVRAARTLGARPAEAFLRIFLPLSIPGIVSGGLIVFIVSLGFFITPTLLGGPQNETWAMLVQQQLDIFGDFQTSAALALVLLVVTVLLLIAFGLVIGFDQFVGGRVRAQVLLSRSPGSLVSTVLRVSGPVVRCVEWRTTWRLFVVLALLYLVIPYAVLLPMSLGAADYVEFPPTNISTRWYVVLATDPRWLSGALTSITVGLGAMVGAVSIGLIAAMGLRGMRNRVAPILVATLMAPAMIPPMVYSVGAFFWAVRFRAVDTAIAVALAHSALAVPFVLVIVATALSALNPHVEFAARSAGAGAWTAFRRITLPLIAPALVICAVVSFQQSFDEIVVALFLTGIQTRTLPMVMWQAVRLELNPSLAAASVVVFASVLVLALVGLVISRLLSPRARARLALVRPGRSRPGITT